MLVLIVILVFLQSWRALLVPATTVPVTIIGAFAFMPFLGFSVNLLTLFGLVLAIGIVVDDAIVIVENASHHIETGMAPREATIQAMSEVTGPIIAITLVLMAVFLPTAFLGGITGQLYRQFALTIAATALISADQRADAQAGPVRRVAAAACRKNGWFARGFDAVYRPIERGYAWTVRHLLRVWWLVLLVFVGVAVFTVWWYQQTPTGFLPEEDQGYVIIAVQLRTRPRWTGPSEVDRADEHGVPQTRRDVENWFVLGGFSLLDGTAAPNAATAFIAWKDWTNGRRPNCSRPRWSSGLAELKFADAGGGDHRDRPAGDSGAGVRRRLPDADRGPRRRRAARCCRSGRHGESSIGGRRSGRKIDTAAIASAPSGPACRRST